MAGLPSLKTLVEAELARRTAAGAYQWAPERIVLDGSSDDEARLAAIEAKYPGNTLSCARSSIRRCAALRNPRRRKAAERRGGRSHRR